MRDAASTVNVSRLKGSEIVPLGLNVSVGKTLRPAIQKIVRELAPQKVVLFGSYAYGKPNPHSDVDLLVIMETDQPQRSQLGGIAFVATTSLSGGYPGQDARGNQRCVGIGRFLFERNSYARGGFV